MSFSGEVKAELAKQIDSKLTYRNTLLVCSVVNAVDGYVC